MSSGLLKSRNTKVSLFIQIPDYKSIKNTQKYSKNQFYFFIGFPREAIKITMPDGAFKEGKSFETSPFTIASAISAQFAGKIISAKVKYSRRIATLDDGLINPIAESNVSEDEQWFAWDLTRPFEGDCDL
jgi:hypothetical protein